ncbi:uncharacterized protein LOC144704826 [Wolffia australiana]
MATSAAFGTRAAARNASMLPAGSSGERRRREFLSMVVGVGMSAGARGGGEAEAAGRRPPPPPPKEKKDPSLSPLQAKVLASIKRKEAMKEAVAQLRQQGKPVDGSN